MSVNSERVHALEEQVRMLMSRLTGTDSVPSSDTTGSFQVVSETVLREEQAPSSVPHLAGLGSGLGHVDFPLSLASPRSDDSSSSGGDDPDALAAAQEQLRASWSKDPAASPSVGSADEAFYGPLPSDVVTDSRLSPGMKVSIIGLKSKPELNGTICVLGAYQPARERWIAFLEGEDNGILLRAENLAAYESHPVQEPAFAAAFTPFPESGPGATVQAAASSDRHRDDAAALMLERDEVRSSSQLSAGYADTSVASIGATCVLTAFTGGSSTSLPFFEYVSDALAAKIMGFTNGSTTVAETIGSKSIRHNPLPGPWARQIGDDSIEVLDGPTMFSVMDESTRETDLTLSALQKRVSAGEIVIERASAGPAFGIDYRGRLSQPLLHQDPPAGVVVCSRAWYIPKQGTERQAYTACMLPFNFRPRRTGEPIQAEFAREGWQFFLRKLLGARTLAIQSEQLYSWLKVNLVAGSDRAIMP